MNSEAFIVRCSACQRKVSVTTVHEFHNVGGFRGYSYSVSCECGVVSHHDGNDGEQIPNSLKRSAAIRERAYTVLGKIDYQRRNLPGSPEKAMLRNARLNIPEEVDVDSWLVYRSDNWRVTFNPSSETYHLHDADGVHAYSDLGILSSNIRGG